MCPTCGKAFRVRANYYKHRKIHERTSIEQHQQDSQENGEVEDQKEAQQADSQPASNEIANVTVTLPTPSTGLLETFNVGNILFHCGYFADNSIFVIFFVD